MEPLAHERLHCFVVVKSLSPTRFFEWSKKVDFPQDYCPDHRKNILRFPSPEVQFLFRCIGCMRPCVVMKKNHAFDGFCFPFSQKYQFGGIQHFRVMLFINSASIMKEIEMNNVFPITFFFHYLTGWQSRLHYRPLVTHLPLDTGLFRFGCVMMHLSFIADDDSIQKRVSLLLESFRSMLLVVFK